MGVVSTRTPEGEPVQCPVCGGQTHVAPSTYPTIDAPCPSCGHLLWLSNARSLLYDPLAVRELVATMQAAIERGAERLQQLQATDEPIPSAEPTNAALGLHEVTNPVEIRVFEGYVVNRGC